MSLSPGWDLRPWKMVAYVEYNRSRSGPGIGPGTAPGTDLEGKGLKGPIGGAMRSKGGEIVFEGEILDGKLFLPGFQLDLSGFPEVPKGPLRVTVLPHPNGLLLAWGRERTVVRPELSHRVEAYFGALTLLHFEQLAQERDWKLDPKLLTGAFLQGASWPEVWLCFLDLKDSDSESRSLLEGP